MTDLSFSYLSELRCSKCDERYDADTLQNLSRCCSAPLLAVYDLTALRDELTPADIASRPSNLWRYHELLPVRDPRFVRGFDEGMTPMFGLPRLGEAIGVPRLLVKDEAPLPTGSFKARGAAVGVSRAAELGVRRLAMPTNGNAGAAWAAYCARSGIEATVVMPTDAPTITRSEAALAGASVTLVNGLISDAGRMVGELVGRGGVFDASTLKEPYRVEGKKTMGLEILEQFGWRAPDVIAYPTGGGVGLIGIYKALLELQTLGWIGSKLPRMVAVQAEGCDPIVQAFERGEDEVQAQQDTRTIAFGINVPSPLGGRLVLEAVRATNGTAIAVSDEDLLSYIGRCASMEGLLPCPEGASTMTAVAALRKSGWISESDEVVVLNTGAGNKYADAVAVELPIVQRDASLVDAQ
ncbi:threonine synthase [Knoellia sp. Soil729]|uniref:threonine synthase n=1 Tax=Knoellia sp. Soil729 TaxID=1736394 RepID=UPI0006F5A652|nr:threonine synthase [Knoellia sp. Soil729]KRE40253.1 threonine synthase [Knoellia sp. Soil729]